MANAPLVPAIYGPSGDVTWEGADPTNTPEAAGRGAEPDARVTADAGIPTPRISPELSFSRGGGFRWTDGHS